MLSQKPRPSDLNLRLACGLLLGIAWLLPGFLPDFGVDFAAATGWWQGQDPHGLTAELLQPAHAELALRYPDNVRTVHPPAATVLALPLARLDWETARGVWFLVSWGAIVAGWHVAGISPLVCLATVPMWIFCLALGTHEPLLFVLLAWALRDEDTSPTWTGACLGCAAAIKVYPLVLLAGLWLAGRRRAVVAAILTGLAITVVSELILGPGTTWDWLRHVPVNTAQYVDDSRNIALVSFVRDAIPGFSPLVFSVVAGSLLLWPLLPTLRRGNAIRPLLPLMLLISPLTWRYYLGVLALAPLRRFESVCLAISPLVLLLGNQHVIPTSGLPALAESALLLLMDLPLMLALVIVWARHLPRPGQFAAAAIAAKEPTCPT